MADIDIQDVGIGVADTELEIEYQNPLQGYSERAAGAVAIEPPVGPAVIGSDATLLAFGVLMPLDDRA